MDGHSKIPLVREDSVRGQDEILLSESKSLGFQSSASK